MAPTDFPPRGGQVSLSGPILILYSPRAVESYLQGELGWQILCSYISMEPLYEGLDGMVANFKSPQCNPARGGQHTHIVDLPTQQNAVLYL